MNLVREQAAFLQDICKLIQHATRCGFIVTGGELERKPELQEIYVKIGRSKIANSTHLRKCALDLNFFADRNGTLELIYDINLLQPVGDYWERLNPKNRWGGNWRTFDDLPHFERSLSIEAGLKTPAKTRPETADVITLPTKDQAPPVPHFESMATIQRGSNDDRAVVLLQICLQHLGYLDEVDGKFGPGTETAVKQLQKENGLAADGIVGEKTWKRLFTSAPQVFQDLSAKNLTQRDLDQAAEQLQVEPQILKAVLEVEAHGTGFIGTKPKILFEGHVFWQRLKDHGIDPETCRVGNDEILYQNWTKQYYAGGLREYARLDRACRIHEEAALESASWGLFQIMGHHYKRLGYASVRDFAQAMDANEAAHLEAFCKFVKSTRSQGKPLVEYLRQRDWAGFAYGYNGAGYRDNRYDERLEAAYDKACATLA